MERNGGNSYPLNHNNNNSNELGGKTLQGLPGVSRMNQLSSGNGSSVFNNTMASPSFNSGNPAPPMDTNSSFLPTDPRPNLHLPYGPPGTNPLTPIHHLIPPPPLDGSPYPTELYAELMKNRAGLGYLPPGPPSSSADMMPFYDVAGMFPFPPHMYGFRSVR